MPCLFNFSGNLVWRRSSTSGTPCAAPSDGQSQRLARLRLRFRAVASLWVATPDERRLPTKPATLPRVGLCASGRASSRNAPERDTSQRRGLVMDCRCHVAWCRCNFGRIRQRCAARPRLVHQLPRLSRHFLHHPRCGGDRQAAGNAAMSVARRIETQPP